MALNLLYRSTFIDVNECASFPEEVPEIARRAGSAPPPLRRDPSPSRGTTQLWVAALAQRAQQLHTLLRLKQVAPTEPGLESPKLSKPRMLWAEVVDCSTEASSLEEEANERPNAMKPPADPKVLRWPNAGSVGHPAICKRPCMHFVAGSCTNGDLCDYCHLSHNMRPTHLDKRQRELLTTLSEARLLAVALHYLEAQARAEGFFTEAAELFALLRHQANLGPGKLPDPEPAVPKKAWPKFDYMIQRMTFQGILGLVMKSKSINEDFAQQVACATNRMRRKLLQTHDFAQILADFLQALVGRIATLWVYDVSEASVPLCILRSPGL
ncbi:unnamed protein product [Effrenium voratum]|uniref:C3H1-type domain-containing protein n=2 Tax=Effrenium voratum TaxID=2562239 RepID=A0AA36HYB0_9DINO|nr:unnamed protein product [Effrenium voratum]